MNHSQGILQVFNRYLQYGGEESCVMRIGEALREKYEVDFFLSSSEEFVKPGFINKITLPFYAFHNPQILASLKEQQKQKNYNCWMVHNVFPGISPGVYALANEMNVPVIQYLHNYKFGCVNGFLFHKGEECRKCIKGNFLPAIKDATWRDSRTQTAVMAGVISYARNQLNVFQGISHWVAISEAQKKIHVEMGIPEKNISVIPHFYERDTSHDFSQFPKDGYALFVGRLSPEKGVDRLIQAWSLLPKNRKLVVMGDGSEMNHLKNLAQSMKLDNVTFLGFVPPDAQKSCWDGAAFSIVPSVWQEPFGMVLLESWARGKPIVAHRIGALPEIIDDEVNGFLAEVDDVSSLATTIEKAFSLGTHLKELGMNGLRKLDTKYNRATWLQSIDQICKRVTSNTTVSASIHAIKNNNNSEQTFHLNFYLADQNPKAGRSLGISRMTSIVLKEMQENKKITIHCISSKTSLRSEDVKDDLKFPWSTKTRFMRVLTDNIHPAFVTQNENQKTIWYYPKGFLPFWHDTSRPSVVTIHDMIIQYYADHYPESRSRFEYSYWIKLLKNTLLHSDLILTISESSKNQIEHFIEQTHLPKRNIIVTYEPCVFEEVSQPHDIQKEDYVLHFSSKEPHKNTYWLLTTWKILSDKRPNMPKLLVVGDVSKEWKNEFTTDSCIIFSSFLEESALKDRLMHAKALAFPSLIEGFGLPAIEAYYLGTSVCYTKGTSVEEVISHATSKGGFISGDVDSFYHALQEVLDMKPDEIYDAGLKLREKFAAKKIVNHIYQEMCKLI